MALHAHDLSRWGALALAAGLTLVLAGCDEPSEERPDSPVEDTSDTTSSGEVSGPADAADTGTTPNAETTDLATVVFDGTPLIVSAVSCEDGPEFTGTFTDGGELVVAGQGDGTVIVRIVVPRGGASLAWAAQDAGSEQLTLLPEATEGELTVDAVDDAGAPDPDRDPAELVFELPCDA